VCNLEMELRIGSRINERELEGRIGGVEVRERGGRGEEEVLREGGKKWFLDQSWNYYRRDVSSCREMNQ
jgi:hypothetical protein